MHPNFQPQLCKMVEYNNKSLVIQRKNNRNTILNTKTAYTNKINQNKLTSVKN